MIRFLILGFALILAVGCADKPKKSDSNKQAAVVAGAVGLTFAEAQSRALRVSNPQYDLTVKLNNTDTFYTGKVRITFMLKDPSQDLSLDYRDGKISNLAVNGKELSGYKYDQKFLQLPKASLVVGVNTVEISFQNDYSTSGVGLHRFQDPEDKKVYLYTQFEPFDANRFLPCFDQPDLKAKMNLTVEAPKDWQVITTTMEKSTKAVGNDQKLWVFNETPKMSTYLFSLHAGPYKVWTAKAGKIPLRLFARATMAKYVNPEEWFVITRQGLDFFGRYFDYPYPFLKYDQVIAPEFNMGAMENIGAVTFSENYVRRGGKTRQQRASQADVVLHEMAHMWFGDLVTMKWWGDLWLNESFATYMAAVAMTSATEFKDYWRNFHGEKEWAYWEDQLVTTHPIEATINNTAEAFTSFDGITYGKGASVMQQLSYYMGPEQFKKGVQAYFKKYAYQNAELKDFIGSLSANTKHDLNAWANLWLKQSGVDTLASTFECKDGKVSALNLTLASTTGAQFRPQAFEVGLLKATNGKMKVSKVLPVTMTSGKLTVKEANGLACPDVVFANLNDYAYLKLQLDAKSLESIKTSLSKIEDDFARSLIWDSLWHMVRDQQISVQDYMEVVRNHLPSENDFKILSKVATSVAGGGYAERNSVYYYFPTNTDAQRSQRAALVTEIQKMFWDKLQSAAPGSDLQKLWFESFVNSSQDQWGLTKIEEILSQKTQLKGFKVDPDRRWKALAQLCRFGSANSHQMLEAEQKADTSQRGIKNAIACSASFPEAQAKQKWFEQIVAEKSPLSYDQQRSVMNQIFPYEQNVLAETYANQIFTFIDQNMAKRDEEYLSSFTGALAPATCTQESQTRMKSYIEGRKLTPVVLRELRITNQEDERCWKIRSLAAGHANKTQN